MDNKNLPRVTPGSVGISSKAISDFLDYIENCGTEMHGLMIMRHGKVAAEGWWAPYSKALKHNSWSLTKSYVATAVGVACDRGLVHLEDRIMDYFTEYLPEHPDEKLQKMKVRHLLSMSCGMEPNAVSWDAEWIRRFFSTPILHEPGSVFFYNNEASSLLAVLIKRVTGKNFLDYLYEHVLDKIGIAADDVSCIPLKDGNLFGAAGIFSTTEANARLGQLYLQKGKWDGQQVISESWVHLATTKQIAVSFPKMDEMKMPRKKMRIEHAGAGYGFQMWMCAYPDSFRFDGAMGQYVVVLPTLDMLVAINESSTAAPDGPICVLNAVFDYLVPGVDTGEPVNEELEACVQNRLRRLSMPKPDEMRCTAATMAAVNKAAFKLAEGPAVSLVPDIFEHIIGTPSAMETLTLDFSDIDCLLTYTDCKGRHELHIGTDGIARMNFMAFDLPIHGYAAAQGAWTSDDRFAINICYPETCFSLLLELTFGGQASLTRTENLTFSGLPVESRVTQINRIVS